MDLALSKLKGMTPDIEVNFKSMGLKTTDDLFNVAVTPAGRAQLAECAHVSDQIIMELANRADLSRIKGIAGVYSDLLEEAGVDTVVELAKRVADNLYAKILEVNKAKNLVNRAPGKKQVGDWIEQAKKLPRVVSY